MLCSRSVSRAAQTGAMPTRKVPIPCIERLEDGRGCPRYAIPGKSRCEEHQREVPSRGGTTPAWSRARTAALKRAGYRCEECGRTEQQARDAGTWLEVHHVEGEGVRAETHDLAKLKVLCRVPCHKKTLRKKGTWRQRRDEQQAQIKARAAARRSEAGG